MPVPDSDGSGQDISPFDPTPAGSSEETSIPGRPTVAIRIPKQANEDASVVQYQDEREQLNSSLQLVWSESVQAGNNTVPPYRKVAALLISWDVECDDLNTKGEVERLEALLTEKFNFKVKNAFLNNGKRELPQVQVMFCIAEFVKDEDDHNTLLIVYYAGHGIPGHTPGRLELSGKRSPTNDDLDTVIWNLAEATLQHTKADIFEIFDCCYAGDLGRGSSTGTRSFEFLGATSSGTITRSPGCHSFTTALIWALKQLVEEDTRFTTSTLAKKIRDAPGFPVKQVPTLIERNAASIVRIVLAPVPKSGQPTEVAKEESLGVGTNRELLSLKLVLEKRPTKKEVESLARGVKMMIQTEGLVIHNVIWGGLQPWPSSSLGLHSPIVKEAAKRFIGGARRSRPETHQRHNASIDKLPSQTRFASFGRAHGETLTDPSPCSEPSHTRQLGVSYHLWMAFISFWFAIVSLNALEKSRGYIWPAGVGLGLYIFSIWIGFAFGAW